MANPYLNFETLRLYLRPVVVEDADLILELFNTPKWIAYIGDRNVKSIADAAQYIETKMLPQIERVGFGNYVVVRKEDNKKIGTCGLYDREGLDAVDIGFAFLPAYERLGYAFEAADKIKNAAFRSFNLPQICAITTKTNLSSQKLLKKIGMHYIKMISMKDDDEELMYYELNNDYLSKA